MRPARRTRWILVGVLLLLGGACTRLPVSVASAACAPTRPDALGPFYKPNAPQRDTTGQGLSLVGTVRAAPACTPLATAQLEWWAANAQGEYDMAHRATQQVESTGQYRYTTDVPGVYPGRPPHLHVRVTAPGYRTLVTQIYPSSGQTAVTFDFVLVPD